MHLLSESRAILPIQWHSPEFRGGHLQLLNTEYQGQSSLVKSEQCFSVGESDLDANAMGCSVPFFYDVKGQLRLRMVTHHKRGRDHCQNCKLGEFNSFGEKKAFSCSDPQNQWDFFCNGLQTGGKTVERLGRNLLQQFRNSTNDLSSVTFCGCGAFRIALTFSSVSRIPSLEIVCPKYCSSWAKNMHLDVPLLFLTSSALLRGCRHVHHSLSRQQDEIQVYAHRPCSRPSNAKRQCIVAI